LPRLENREILWHTLFADKGKPSERMGRKAIGPKSSQRTWQPVAEANLRMWSKKATSGRLIGTFILSQRWC